MKNFIICLSQIPASFKTANDLYNKLIEYNTDVELFEGTYGNDAVVQMELEGRQLGKLKKSCTSKQIEKMSAPGVKGCFYSHYRLWNKCIELNEPITIWEDDIILTRKFIPIEWEGVLIVAIGHPTKSIPYMGLLEMPTGTPQALEYTKVTMPGLCGYCIKPHAAKILVEQYSNTYLPADNAITRKLVNIEIHSHLMGIALTKRNGNKISLTRNTEIWNHD